MELEHFVTLYLRDDSSRLDARVSPIPSGSTGLNGARRFTNLNPYHHSGRGGHFLVVSPTTYIDIYVRRTRTHARTHSQYDNSRITHAGICTLTSPGLLCRRCNNLHQIVYSSRSGLVTPRNCTAVGRSGSGSQVLQQLCPHSGDTNTSSMGGASAITRFGHTRNYYFNASPPPSATLAQNFANQNPKPRFA